MKKIFLIFFTLILIDCNIYSQSPLGIFGAVTGKIIKETSKKNEWKIIGKAIQTAGEMQYELDKIKLKNKKDINIKKEITYNLPQNTYKDQQGLIHPIDGYEWQNPLDKNNFSVTKINYTIDNKIYELNNLASDNIDNGNYKVAIEYATQSINIRANESGYFFRTFAYLGIQDFQKALNDLNLTLDFAYDNIIFFFFFGVRGYINAGFKEYDKALSDINSALSMKLPNDIKNYAEKMYPELLSNRASVKLALYDFNGALNDCNKVLQITPNNVSIYSVRGLIKVSQEDYQGAIKDFSYAIDNKEVNIFTAIDKDYTYRSLVKILYLKDYQGAIIDANKAIEINPKSSGAYYCRGLSKIKLNIFEGGCLDLSKSGELGNTEAYSMIKKYCNK